MDIEDDSFVVSYVINMEFINMNNLIDYID